ncbi:MAG: hypothetical protein WCI52_02660 [bacterium]
MMNKKTYLFLSILFTIFIVGPTSVFAQTATCSSPSRTGSDNGEYCYAAFSAPHTNSYLTGCSPISTTYPVAQYCGRGCVKDVDTSGRITDFNWVSGNSARLSPSIDYCGKCGSNKKCEDCPLACNNPTWGCTKNTCSASDCGKTIDDGCGGTVVCDVCSVTGSCGTINNTNQTWPSSGTWCSAGTQRGSIEGIWDQKGDQSNSNLWKWSCNGSGRGTNASCSFTQQCGAGQVLSNGYCVSSVINGSCGTINGTNQTWPSSGTWCSAGTQSGSIEGIWDQKGDQSNSNLWKWSCNGSNGGSNTSSCSFTQQCGVGYTLNNGICTGNSCIGPDGANIPSGTSKTYYTTQNSNSCSTKTEVRTCTAGTLSGTAQYNYCSNSCIGPDGSVIASGWSKTYYKDAVSTSCSNASEIRTCINGVLSPGTYTNSSCVNSSLTLTVNPTISNGICTLAYSLTNYPAGYDPNSNCHLSSAPSMSLPNLSFGLGNGIVKSGITTASSVSRTTTFSLSCPGTNIPTATAKCSAVPKYIEF